MALSWSPNFDFFGVNNQGLGDVDEFVTLAVGDGSTTNVLFVMSPDSCSVAVDFFTEQERVVLPNANDVGDIRFSVWTYEGPNAADDAYIVLDDGGSGVFDGHASFSVMYGQVPYANAVVALSEDLTGEGSASFSAATGPTLGCLAILDTAANPTITYPGDQEHFDVNYAHAGDGTTAGNLTGFASDLAGSFSITSAVMRHVFLIGPGAATRKWWVGVAGWGSPAETATYSVQIDVGRSYSSGPQHAIYMDPATQVNAGDIEVWGFSENQLTLAPGITINSFSLTFEFSPGAADTRTGCFILDNDTPSTLYGLELVQSSSVTSASLADPPDVPSTGSLPVTVPVDFTTFIPQFFFPVGSTVVATGGLLTINYTPAP